MEDLVKYNIDFLSQWCLYDFLKELETILFGCSAQCVFCHVVCDSTIDCEAQNQSHTSEFHRPQGFSGWNWKNSNELMYDICNFSIASNNKFRLTEENRKKYKIASDDYL